LKLAAIYNVWDGDELLEASIKTIQDHVDIVILVLQSVSNYGESHTPIIPLHIHNTDYHMIHYIPIGVTNPHNNPGQDERNKRNMGLDKARELGATHFLHMDCDELYHYFGEMKTEFLEKECNGSVAQMYTYFKKPTLRLQFPDNYYVPFIHKLDVYTQSGGPQTYPFYVDPTRKINTTDVELISSFKMHHFSWVRKDIGRKIRNSTAKNGIERTNILEIYNDPETGAGTYIDPLYRQELIEVPDQFNLSSIFE